MECAHRGDKPDGPTLHAVFLAGILHDSGYSYDLHIPAG